MIIVALLSALIGISLGLLGGGGSILAVPVLAYGAGMPAKEAIATSLLVVGTTSLFAMLQHARAGNVEWRTGFVFSGAAMAGAYLGGRAADWFSGTTLLLLFAGMMVVTAAAMFRGRKERAAAQRDSLPILLVVAEGLVVGGATGLVGAGGGFLVVPALVLLGGMDMHRAIGTSLLVIGLKSFAAFAGHAAHVSIDYPLALLVTGAAVAGTFVGARLARGIPAEKLRKGFALFVLVMAGYVIWREAGDRLVQVMPGWAWLSVALAAAAGGVVAMVARAKGAPVAGGSAH
ncbi:MAG: sulfite exporter TauE/SafE family protein [Myxococcales bacterium]|nr:sulfite exporter TauE/SafE family protein [Myxococcales bacterium]